MAIQSIVGNYANTNLYIKQWKKIREPRESPSGHGRLGRETLQTRDQVQIGDPEAVPLFQT